MSRQGLRRRLSCAPKLIWMQLQMTVGGAITQTGSPRTFLPLSLRSWLWVGRSTSKLPIHNSVSDRSRNDTRESKSLISLLKRSDSGWQGQKHGYFLLVADSACACVGTWLTLEEQEHNKEEKEGERGYKYREENLNEGADGAIGLPSLCPPCLSVRENKRTSTVCVFVCEGMSTSLGRESFWTPRPLILRARKKPTYVLLF